MTVKSAFAFKKTQNFTYLEHDFLTRIYSMDN